MNCLLIKEDYCMAGLEIELPCKKVVNQIVLERKLAVKFEATGWLKLQASRSFVKQARLDLLEPSTALLAG